MAQHYYHVPRAGYSISCARGGLGYQDTARSEMDRRWERRWERRWVASGKGPELGRGRGRGRSLAGAGNGRRAAEIAARLASRLARRKTVDRAHLLAEMVSPIACIVGRQHAAGRDCLERSNHYTARAPAPATRAPPPIWRARSCRQCRLGRP